ncbi:MAG: TetR/AcrR family transcriptional regulator [Acidimicrobiales bacterium]
MNAVDSTVGKGADDSRERVLRAALEVIAERGFDSTRLSDVAERAGVSPALVVYYFKTKDTVLTEAIRLGEQSWYEAVDRRLRGHERADDRLDDLVAMTFFSDDDSGEPWSLWLDLWAQSVHHREVGDVRHEFDAEWRKTIRDLVVDGQQRGEFGESEPDDFAVSLSALLDGFAIQIALEDSEVNADRAYALTMRFASEHLGFKWDGRHKGASGSKKRGRR